MAANQEYRIVNNKKYELVPPDGGWGYMICIAACINYSTVSMFAGCFGLMYKDLLINLDMNSTSVTLVQGLSALSVAISAYFASDLLKIMSLRKLGFLAATIFNAGMVGSISVNSEPVFYLSFSLLGFGLGVIHTITCTIINDYFVKRRMFCVSTAQTMSGLAGFLAPQIVTMSIDSFGFKGARMLLTGITLQMFAGVALMQPVEWHMKKVEVSSGNTEELKLLVKVENVADKAVVTTPTITVSDVKQAFDVEHARETKKGTSSTILRHIIDAFDFKLIKKFCLSAAALGTTFAMFAEMVYTLMLPQAFYAEGWDQDAVARGLMLASLGDVVTRTSFIFISNWLMKLGSQELYLINLVITFVARFGMLSSEKPIYVLLFLTLIGASRTCILIMMPVILAEVFPPEEFTKAMGIALLVFGVMNMTLGPAIGAMRDVTQSYSTAFWILTSLFAVVFVLWSVELLYKKTKHRRKQQLMAAEELRRTKQRIRNMNK